MMTPEQKAAAEKERVPHFDIVPAPNTDPNVWPQSAIDDGADDDTVTDVFKFKHAPLEQVQNPPKPAAPKAEEGEKTEEKKAE